MTDLAPLRARIAADHLAPETPLLHRLIAAHAPDAATRQRAAQRGAAFVTAIRAESRPGLMEVFLAEYGLSTDEGIALMCLAEALLRVPDPATMDDLIEDKIAPSEWGRHLGQSSSPLVNASTWALMLTGKVLTEDREPGIAATLRSAVKRLGEPVIRAAVQRAMKEMGQQFVLGETIADAIRRGRAKAAQGFTFSYDMLGEAAMTADDAAHYLAAYRGAIAALAAEARSDDIRANPGISIKLSALHPRYEEWQRARVMSELAPVVLSLAQQAKAARMGLNIDAEEADRLELSLDLIEAVLSDPSLAGWDGFGIVVQGYGKRAAAVIDWLHALAAKLDRRIMVRLVKGAYWDTEVKRAQVDGFPDFPVWTRKTATDVAYICCASKLLGMTDRIYPQFATHNAHTAAAILEMADGRDDFEFQRLHGMGEALHDTLVKSNAARSRIYAPVGAHRDLLAYLVRRLLENGANSSFVNQVVDTSVPATQVATDPFTALDHAPPPPPPGVDLPRDLFAPRRANSRGLDLRHPATLAEVDAARAPFRAEVWEAAPLLAGEAHPEAPHDLRNPANPTDLVGHVSDASPADIETAVAAAAPWSAIPRKSAPKSSTAPPTSTRRTWANSSRFSPARPARPSPTRCPNCARRWISCATTPPSPPPTPLAAPSPASRPGTSPSPSSPARSPVRSPRATPSSPNPPRRRPSSPTARSNSCTKPASPARRSSSSPAPGPPSAPPSPPTRASRASFHRLHGHGQAHRPRHGRPPRPLRPPRRRDRRPQRDDRGLHRAPRTGGPRHRRLRLPLRRPALLGAPLPLCAGGRGRPRADDARRRHATSSPWATRGTPRPTSAPSSRTPPATTSPPMWRPPAAKAA
jgi:proline dehydrogenase